MGFNLALATAAPAGGIMSMLPTIVIFGALLYFMIIRPQKETTKRSKFIEFT